MYNILIISLAIVLLLVISFLVIILRNLKRHWALNTEMQNLKMEQQNQLIEAAVRSEEIERHRIAEALHDEVGAILSSSKLHFQGIKEESLSDRDKEIYGKGKELLNEGIQKVRGISHNLHSNILKEFGLNEAIRHFIKLLSKGSLVDISSSLDDRYQTVNPENDISIYRMLQELVNNIIKHAEASEISISSEYRPDLLSLMIAHNGNGLTQKQFEELRYKKEGLGLKNIMNRVILLRGNIQFRSERNDSHITLFIPLNAMP